MGRSRSHRLRRPKAAMLSESQAAVVADDSSRMPCLARPSIGPLNACHALDRCSPLRRTLPVRDLSRRGTAACGLVVRVKADAPRHLGIPNGHQRELSGAARIVHTAPRAVYATATRTVTLQPETRLLGRSGRVLADARTPWLLFSARIAAGLRCVRCVLYGVLGCAIAPSVLCGLRRVKVLALPPTIQDAG